VSYGQTVICKPGASTDEGKVLTGADVQRMLGEDFQVFPMAVEYAPSIGAILEAFGDVEEDVADVEAELDAIDADGELDDDGDDDSDTEKLGGRVRRSARLEKKYLKALARFSKCQTLLQAGRGRTSFARKLLTVAMPFSYLVGNSKNRRLRNRASRCDKLYRDLQKVRSKMVKKQIDVSRLPHPQSFLADVASKWERRRHHATRPTRPAPSRPYPTSYTPASKQVQSELYHRDQAALEREMASITPSYGVDDLRAIEGVIDVELATPITDELGQEDLSADLRAETVGYLHSGVEHDYFGLAGSSLETIWDSDRFLDAEIMFRDEDDEDLLEDGSLEGDLDADLVSAIAGDEDLGADDDVAGDEELGADGSDEELGAGNDDDLVDAVAKTDDSDDSDDLSDSDDDLELPSSADAGDDEEERASLPESISSGIAALRAGLFRKISEAMSDGEPEEKVGSLIRKLDKATKKLQSVSGGVDYGRIQPKSENSSSETPPVVVIAIRKREPNEKFRQDIRGAIESVGGVYGEESGLIDVFGAQLFQVKHGYTPVESMKALRESVRPSEWVRGSSAQFPVGDDSPLLPPRRVGSEVNG
jgi:hypothetical protein